MIGRPSHLSLPNKILLYKQILRPMLTYGSLVWGTSAPSYVQKLQVIQNKFCRIAVNAPIDTNTKILQEELGIEPLSVFIKNMNSKKLLKAQQHSNPLVTQSLNYEPTHRFRRNRPLTVLIPPPVP